jgi:hypothetical protein
MPLYREGFAGGCGVRLLESSIGEGLSYTLPSGVTAKWREPVSSLIGGDDGPVENALSRRNAVARRSGLWARGAPHSDHIP